MTSSDTEHKSLLWMLVESSTRFWANWLSPLSVPGLTTGKSKPLYDKEHRRFLSIRDMWYLFVLGLATFLCFGAGPWVLASPATWPSWVLLGVAAHQIIDFVVLMIRLSLFGNHDKYEPFNWLEVARIRKERSMLVLVLCYVCTLMWFAVLYLALMGIDPGSIRGAPEFASMSEPTRALALSIAGQTTVVYGAVAPLSLILVLISGVQTLIGLFYIALAVANVLSIMNSTKQ